MWSADDTPRPVLVRTIVEIDDVREVSVDSKQCRMTDLASGHQAE